MKVILIRHGMTEGNRKKRYIGSTDEGLTDIECLMGGYPDCDIVVSSPMKRCVQTAEFIYPKKRILICEKLCECDFGDFENKSYEELKDDPYYIRWLESGGRLPFPGGESHEDFVKRCVEGFFEVLEKTDKTAAFVIHGGSIMAIMQNLFGGDFYDYQVKNGGGYMFDIENGGTVNDYCAVGCA